LVFPVKGKLGQSLTGDEDKHMNEELNETRDFGFIAPSALFNENRSQPNTLFLLG
jgi:hypothetical protein